MNWRRGLFRLWIVGTALFVLAIACTGQTASASVHRSFYQCGNHLITDAWTWDRGHSWWLISKQNNSWHMPWFPSRLVKLTTKDVYCYQGVKGSEPLAFNALPDGVKTLIWVSPPKEPEP